MKNFIILLIIIVAGFGVYYLSKNASPKTDVETEITRPLDDVTVEETQNKEETPENKESIVIGKSAQENEIIAYHYGNGNTELLFVGGIHGGYSWNTTLVAYELADYLKANPVVVPSNLKVTIIPVLNPDGLKKVAGTTGRFTKSDISASQAIKVSGRFNGNNVDLSRNFNCNWKPTGMWQTTSVSGGSKAFSEPESQAVQNYVEKNKPIAVVVWYSAAGGVYASSCNNGILPETSVITNLYSKASGYPAYESFDFYETTGDMVNWLAKSNIPAISVLLSTHNDVEWDKNKKGVEALLQHYAK